MGFPLVRLYGFVALALVWRYRASTAAYSGFLASGGYGDCHSPSWLTGAYSGSGLFLKIVGLASGFFFFGLVHGVSCYGRSAC